MTILDPPKLPPTPPPLTGADSSVSQRAIIITGVILLLLIVIFLASVLTGSKAENSASGTDSQMESPAIESTEENDDGISLNDDQSPEPDPKHSTEAIDNSEGEETDLTTEQQKDSGFTPQQEQHPILEEKSPSDTSNVIPVPGFMKNRVRFFSIETGAADTVFVIDKSSSMTGEKFSRVIKELENSLLNLKSDSRFQVIFFSDQAVPLSADLKLANTKNKKDVNDALHRQRPGGGTFPWPAMQKALEAKPNAIFLLSDGEFSDHVVSQITSANTLEIPIHTVSIGSDAVTLRKIAGQNKGFFRLIH